MRSFDHSSLMNRQIWCGVQGSFLDFGTFVASGASEWAQTRMGRPGPSATYGGSPITRLIGCSSQVDLSASVRQ